MLDLRISHERWGSRSNPSLDGHLHYPTDIDRTLNEEDPDKVIQYRDDYNNRPSHTITFMSPTVSTSVVYTVNLYSHLQHNIEDIY